MDEKLMTYFKLRDEAYLREIEELASTFSERELLLVKEAAVMGYVRGKMSGPAGPVPQDSGILREVLGAIIGSPALYPTISGYREENDEEDSDLEEDE